MHLTVQQEDNFLLSHTVKEAQRHTDELQRMTSTVSLQSLDRPFSLFAGQSNIYAFRDMFSRTLSCHGPLFTAAIQTESSPNQFQSAAFAAICCRLAPCREHARYIEQLCSPPLCSLSGKLHA